MLLTLLVTVIVYPFILKKKTAALLAIHPEAKVLGELATPVFKRVAVALDFRSQDEKLLSFAIGQGKPTSEFILIHVVESASAKLLGEVTDDLESRKDEERLESYVSQLRERGFSVKGRLGYRNRKEEIVRIVKQENVDLLVMGAHGHAGMKDWIYGATINHVRHELKIPVLVVNV